MPCAPQARDQSDQGYLAAAAWRSALTAARGGLGKEHPLTQRIECGARERAVRVLPKPVQPAAAVDAAPSPPVPRPPPVHTPEPPGCPRPGSARLAEQLRLGAVDARLREVRSAQPQASGPVPPAKRKSTPRVGGTLMDRRRRSAEDAVTADSYVLSMAAAAEVARSAAAARQPDVVRRDAATRIQCAWRRCSAAEAVRQRQATVGLLLRRARELESIHEQCAAHRQLLGALVRLQSAGRGLARRRWVGRLLAATGARVTRSGPCDDTGSVPETWEEPWLEDIGGKALPAIRLTEELTVIGSSEQSDVRLTAPSIQPMHCRLLLSNGFVHAQLLADDGALFVNGISIPCWQLCPLSDGFRLIVGCDYVFRLHVPTEVRYEVTAARAAATPPPQSTTVRRLPSIIIRDTFVPDERWSTLHSGNIRDYVSWLHRNLDALHEEERLDEEAGAATRIQALQRGRQARRRLTLAAASAATTIQCCIRCHLARAELQLRAATAAVQTQRRLIEERIVPQEPLRGMRPLDLLRNACSGRLPKFMRMLLGAVTEQQFQRPGLRWLMSDNGGRGQRESLTALAAL
eukprot:TRINITY_DN28886_c0_g1_i2.p1 TRINITY_DN28886_c0_g1~~TRINITY_DN28886_c0_g1_i2.p1  ORF type:complete len:576 (+),score=110.04 TRINITY_DN28886_c0_g1_i2:624-2351(+)